MLNLFSLFAGAAASQPPLVVTHAVPPAVADDRVSVLAGHAAQAELWQRLSLSGRAVRLLVPGLDDWLESRVGHLDPGFDSLSLQAHADPAVRRMALAAPAINACFELDGRAGLCALTCTGEYRQADQDFYVCLLPDWLMLTELRAMPRFRVHHSHPCWQALGTFFAGADVHCIRDLGEGGVGLLLDAETASRALQAGVFTLPVLQGRAVPAAAVRLHFCHASRTDDGSFWVGCDFVGLEGEALRALRKLLLQVQSTVRRAA